MVFFALAVALSLGAAGFVGSYARRLQLTRPDVGPPTAVVMAAGALTRGAVLANDDVMAASIPSSLVPPGSLTSPDQAAGRVLVADIAEGEILTGTRLGRSGVGPLSALVPAGLRAFSFPTTIESGSLARGDLIDVIATFGANGGRPYTDTVASGLQVVLVAAEDSGIAGASSSGTPSGSITVLADPDTVEALARAAATGIVSFAVIGPDIETLGAVASPSAAAPP
jgi:pilus assembly protein CpaB